MPLLPGLVDKGGFCPCWLTQMIMAALFDPVQRRKAVFCECPKHIKSGERKSHRANLQKGCFTMIKQGRNLQDVFLNAARKEKVDVTVYLTNGVPLNGRVVSFDSFTVLLEIDRRMNMVYKHAISTIVPARPINLKDDEPHLGNE